MTIFVLSGVLAAGVTLGWMIWGWQARMWKARYDDQNLEAVRDAFVASKLNPPPLKQRVRYATLDDLIAMKGL